MTAKTEKEPVEESSTEGAVDEENYAVKQHNSTSNGGEERLELVTSDELIEKGQEFAILGYEKATGNFGEYLRVKVRLPDLDGERMWFTGAKAVVEKIYQLSLPARVQLERKVSKSGRKYQLLKVI